jgi:L-seryl-tRNA(Ser) seleniumtransferase
MPETRAAESAGLLRRIPKVDALLAAGELAPLLVAYPRPEVVRALRATLEELRAAAARGELAPPALAPAAIAERLGRRLERRSRPYYGRVINATGVILHTGLGRAPLAPEAVDALARLAPHPQRVEIDLADGRRGGRDEGCALLLRELTGAEAATVVNNNAAATLLILAALARGKRVLLSRGEMVEIGGSFRVPEILRESGAELAGVGTTNRTHLRDYRDALGDDVGLILKVHTSNYRVVGFTREVDVAALVALGREHGVPVVHDLGSGCLIDLAAHGLPGEPLVQASVAAGADLVCFSGDKLLGGPQAGIVVGRREAVERCRRHPLFRAVRPGRLIYAALEATLRLYLDEDEEVLRKVPALARLTAGDAELRRRARRLARRLAGQPGLAVAAVASTARAGSGSLPARDVPSWAVRLRPETGSAGDLAAALRQGDPPILGRLADDAVLLDLRTLEDDDVAVVAARLAELYPAGNPPYPPFIKGGNLTEGL